MFAPSKSPESRSSNVTPLIVNLSPLTISAPPLAGTCNAKPLSRTGVTGRSGGESGSLVERVAELRTHTRLPIAVGFGISTPDDAKRLAGVADAVVVGAAFMRAISEDPENGAADRVLALAESLIRSLR